MLILRVLYALFRLLLFDASCSNRTQLRLAPWSSRTSTETQLVSFIQLSSNILYKEHLVQICSNGLRCQQSKIVIRSKHKVSKRRTVPRQLGIFAAPHTFCYREFVVNLVSDFHILSHYASFRSIQGQLYAIVRIVDPIRPYITY